MNIVYFSFHPLPNVWLTRLFTPVLLSTSPSFLSFFLTSWFLFPYAFEVLDSVLPLFYLQLHLSLYTSQPTHNYSTLLFIVCSSFLHGLNIRIYLTSSIYQIESLFFIASTKSRWSYNVPNFCDSEYSIPK